MKRKQLVPGDMIVLRTVRSIPGIVMVVLGIESATNRSDHTQTIRFFQLYTGAGGAHGLARWDDVDVRIGPDGRIIKNEWQTMWEHVPCQ